MLEMVEPGILVEARLLLANLRLCLRFFAERGLNLKVVLKKALEDPIAHLLRVNSAVEEVAELHPLPNQFVSKFMKRRADTEVVCGDST